MPRDVGRGKTKLRRGLIGQPAPITKALAHHLPRFAGRCNGGIACFKQAFGAHTQRVVGERQAEERAGISKHVLHRVALGWCWLHLQRMGQYALHQISARTQMGHVLGVLHRWRVVVHRFVDDAQFHGNQFMKSEAV
ncbi:hypothetical protein D3C72_2086210 [compost metagenome]